MKTVTTKKKIGSTTYIVISSSSENAKDNIKTKIEKLIKRDVSIINNSYGNKIN